MVRLLSERINAVLQQYTRRPATDRPSTCPCPTPRRLIPSTALQPKPYACCDACPANPRPAYPTSSTRQPRKLFCPTDIPCPAKTQTRNQIQTSCPKDFPCRAKKQPQTHYKPFIIRGPTNFPCPAKKQTYLKNTSYPTKQQTPKPFSPCPAKWQTNPTACLCPVSRKTCPVDVPCPAMLSTREPLRLDKMNSQYGNADNMNYSKPKCGNPNCFPKPTSPVRNRTTIGSYSSACPPPQSSSYPTCPSCVLSPAGGLRGNPRGTGSNKDGCLMREVVIRGDGERKEAFIKKSWPGDVGGGSVDGGKGEGECHCVVDTVVTRGLALYNANQSTRPPSSPAEQKNSRFSHSKTGRGSNVNQFRPSSTFNKSTPSPSVSSAIPSQFRGRCREGKIKSSTSPNVSQSKRPTVTYAKTSQSPNSYSRFQSKPRGPSRGRKENPNRSSKIPQSQFKGRFGKPNASSSKCSSFKSRGQYSKPKQKQSIQVNECHCKALKKADAPERPRLREFGSDSSVTIRTDETLSVMPSPIERRCCPQCRGNNVAKNTRLTTLEEESNLAVESPAARAKGNNSRSISPARPNQFVPQLRCEIRLCNDLDEMSTRPRLSFKAAGNGRDLHDRQDDEASTRVLYKRKNQKSSGVVSEVERCYCSRCFE